MTDDIQPKRVPWESVEVFDFREGEAPIVSELFLNPEDNKYYHERVHAVSPSGELVCDCVVFPARARFHHMVDFKPEHRWVTCKQSRSYLRTLTTELVTKRTT